MRRPVAAVIAALLAVLALTPIAGCGGDGGETTEVNTETQAPVSGTTPASEEESPPPDLSPSEGQVFEAFPTEDEVLTADIAEPLEVGRPMIVYFYDRSQVTSDDQRAEIDAVLGDYRGLVELVAYDVGKYVSRTGSGEIAVSDELLDDETASKIAKMLGADYLGIKFTPYLVFVNGDGYITFRNRGPLDRKLIEREVLRATD